MLCISRIKLRHFLAGVSSFDLGAFRLDYTVSVLGVFCLGYRVLGLSKILGFANRASPCEKSKEKGQHQKVNLLC